MPAVSPNVSGGRIQKKPSKGRPSPRSSASPRVARGRPSPRSVSMEEEGLRQSRWDFPTQQLQEIQVVKSQIANVDAKLNLILDHLKLDPPVPVAAVAMTERAKPE